MSWSKLTPRTIQSGAKSRSGPTGKGNPYLKGALGEAAAAAARTETFPGERYRRIVKRRGKLKALVAVARSILVVVWHLRPPTPQPDTATSARATTPAASTGTARPAATSANWRPSGTPSPSLADPVAQGSLPDAGLLGDPGDRPGTIRRIAAGFHRQPGGAVPQFLRAISR